MQGWKKHIDRKTDGQIWLNGGWIKSDKEKYRGKKKSDLLDLDFSMKTFDAGKIYLQWDTIRSTPKLSLIHSIWKAGRFGLQTKVDLIFKLK